MSSDRAALGGVMHVCVRCGQCNICWGHTLINVDENVGVGEGECKEALHGNY